MLEGLLDHFLIFDESDDSHLTLVPFDRLRTGLGQVRGSIFPDQVRDRLQFSESASPNAFDIPWIILPTPGCKIILGVLLHQAVEAGSPGMAGTVDTSRTFSHARKEGTNS